MFTDAYELIIGQKIIAIHNVGVGASNWTSNQGVLIGRSHTNCHESVEQVNLVPRAEKLSEPQLAIMKLRCSEYSYQLVHYSLKIKQMKYVFQ